MDNFAQKNNSIIIERLIRKKKDYFPFKNFEMQKIMHLKNFEK